MSLKRRHDWPERLIEFIESRRRMPFEWGRNDCALFAADAVEAMTGEDLAKKWRGYKSERGALRRIKRAGGMRRLAEGLPERPVGYAQRGDVVLVEVEGRDTFGIVVGNGTWCAPGHNGLVFRPMSEVMTVFEI